MRRQLHILFSILVVLSIASGVVSIEGLVKNSSSPPNKSRLNLAINDSHLLQTNASIPLSSFITTNNNITGTHTKPGVEFSLSNASSQHLAYEGMKNIILDASNIYHAKGKITSYSWRQIGGPSVDLNSTVTPSVKFNATCETGNTVLTFRVTTKINNNTSSSSLAHIKIVYGPFSAICREANFSPSTLPLAFKSGTEYTFKLSLGTKFNSISKVIAISEYEPTDPFGNGDRYFINNFGGQTTSNRTQQQTVSVVNNTNSLITDRFLDGNFTSKYIGIQGKFTLSSLKFCIFGTPSVKENGTKNLNSSTLASTSRNIRDQCNIANPQSTTNNTARSSKAVSTAAVTANSTSPATGNTSRLQYGIQQRYPSISPQYSYPPTPYPPSYQAPQYPYPYYPSPSTSPSQYAYPPTPYQPPYQAPQYPYQNLPPVSNAGANQVVNPGTLVVLNGAGSYAPNGGSIISYLWQQTAGGIAVRLAGANTPTPSFIAPTMTSGTTLTFRLTVTNNVGASSSSSVSIFVTGNNLARPPIAIVTTATPIVNRGSIVALDGTRSFTQNGGTIVAYSWAQTGGVSVNLIGSNTARPTFIAPQVPFANLGFSLTVTDSRGLVSNPASSPQSMVMIVVR
jgi:K319-like protein